MDVLAKVVGVELGTRRQGRRGIELLDRETKGLRELLGEAGDQGTAARQEDAGRLPTGGTAANINEAAIDVLREPANEALRVNLQQRDLRIRFREVHDAGVVSHLDRFRRRKGLARVIGDALRQQVATDVGRLNIGAGWADETQRGRTGTHVDDEDFLVGQATVQECSAAVQQRGGLDRIGPQAGGGNQVSDASRHFRAQRKKEDFRFDAVGGHHLAIPDDFVQGVRDRVLSLEGDNLSLTLALDLRHLERLLQQQETRSDNRSLTRNLVGVDEASQGRHGGG